eukprot:574010-Pleurochrysis_carterae.AAC.1
MTRKQGVCQGQGFWRAYDRTVSASREGWRKGEAHANGGGAGEAVRRRSREKTGERGIKRDIERAKATTSPAGD